MRESNWRSEISLYIQDQDQDWAKTAIRITGLRENFVRDGGIEKPYWGPSLVTAFTVYVKSFICILLAL